MSVSTAEWAHIGTIPPIRLVDARHELNWSVQALDAVGRTLAEPAPDSSHVALTWDETIDGLVTAPVGDGTRAGLNFERAELVIVGGDGAVTDSDALTGKTLVEAAGWVQERVAEALGETPDWTPIREDVAPAPAGSGEPFGPPTDAHRELARWYRNAITLFRPIAETEQGASPVLCWPHHIDIATFINLDPGTAQYEGRSVNVGMSPGDATFTEPYFYVVPYPTVGPNGLPVLVGGGFWQTEGWVGAVLSAAAVVSTQEERQAETVESFIRSALSSSKRLLDAD
ncbi:MAG: hypothetical protein MJB57_06465 [Gemmatimonadetes bacterium]|nr:hypothetical protein [Gemmatimonadota bacterium]